MLRLGGVLAAFSVLLLSVATAGGAAASDTIWTTAGTGISANSPDGTQATEAEIDRPRSIFPTADGGYV